MGADQSKSISGTASTARQSFTRALYPLAKTILYHIPGARNLPDKYIMLLTATPNNG